MYFLFRHEYFCLLSDAKLRLSEGNTKEIRIYFYSRTKVSWKRSFNVTIKRGEYKKGEHRSDAPLSYQVIGLEVTWLQPSYRRLHRYRSEPCLHAGQPCCR